MLGPQFLILSTQGGVRAPDGTPIALGYHTGHWEVGLLVQAAAREVKALGGVPFAAYCSDPCDGRTQGTTGMFDSLPYRNDAAIVFRRLIRSLPQRRRARRGDVRQRTAGDDDGPGGRSRLALRPRARRRDAAADRRRRRRQGAIDRRPLRPRRNHAGRRRRRWLCRLRVRPAAAASFSARRPRRRSSPKRWACRCRTRRWRPAASRFGSTWQRRSARAVRRTRPIAASRCATFSRDASIRNAMVVHAAFGGSTNLLLHIPAIAFAAGLRRPTVDDWSDVNRRVPRFVSMPAQRPGRSSDRARVSRRRRAGGHAAPARAGTCSISTC